MPFLVHKAGWIAGAQRRLSCTGNLARVSVFSRWEARLVRGLLADPVLS